MLSSASALFTVSLVVLAAAAAAGEIQTTHVVILSDRYLGTAVVMNSTCSAAAAPSSLAFHVITGREGSTVLPALFDDIAPCAGARLTTETVAEATDALRAHGFAPFWAQEEVAAAVAATPTDEWGVRTPFRDAKHAAPLNHLRFYLPHLPHLEGVGRFIFMDDDIVVQRDVAQLLRSYELKPSKALAAGCQHWQWTKDGFVTNHHTSMLDTGYLGAVDTSCADADAALAAAAQEEGDRPVDETDKRAVRRQALLQKKREQATKSCVRDGLMDELRDVDAAIGGGGVGGAATLRGNRGAASAHPLERTAFNLGFNLIDTASWEELRLTERYEQWVATIVAQKLFPPDTLAFGLVSAYLALGDAVQCYDDEITHLVGLAFIPQERLEGAYGWTAQRMVDHAFALHYNGKNKPWDAPMPECGNAEEGELQTALDIWQYHCGKFCPCTTTTTTTTSVTTTTTGTGNGEESAGGHRLVGHRRLNSVPNEYVGGDDDDDGGGDDDDGAVPGQHTSAATRPNMQLTWGAFLSLLVVLQTRQAWPQ